jgi:hypothetical protein
VNDWIDGMPLLRLLLQPYGTNCLNSFTSFPSHYATDVFLPLLLLILLLVSLSSHFPFDNRYLAYFISSTCSSRFTSDSSPPSEPLMALP